MEDKEQARKIFVQLNNVYEALPQELKIAGWYARFIRTSQQIIENPSENYFSVGHDRYWAGRQMYNNYYKGNENIKASKVWAWGSDTNSFIVQDANNTTSHGIMVDRLEEGGNHDIWTGRFENRNGTKIVSVNVGGRGQIPDDLIAELVAEFGKDIRVNKYR